MEKEKEQFRKLNKEFSEVIKKITDPSLKDEIRQIQDKLSKEFEKLFLYFCWTIFGCENIPDEFTEAKFKLREIKLKLDALSAKLQNVEPVSQNNQELVQYYNDLEVKLLLLYHKNCIPQDTPGTCIKSCGNDRDSVYTACMHMSTCYECCRRIGKKCPLCNKRSAYKRVYIP